MKQTKFIVCLLGIGVVCWISLAGRMSGDVALSLSVVIGGYYGGNTLITRKALETGKAEP